MPRGFGQALVRGNVDRLEPHIDVAINLVPTFGDAGIEDVMLEILNRRYTAGVIEESPCDPENKSLRA